MPEVKKILTRPPQQPWWVHIIYALLTFGAGWLGGSSPQVAAGAAAAAAIPAVISAAQQLRPR